MCSKATLSSSKEELEIYRAQMNIEIEDTKKRSAANLDRDVNSTTLTTSPTSWHVRVIDMKKTLNIAITGCARQATAFFVVWEQIVDIL